MLALPLLALLAAEPMPISGPVTLEAATQIALEHASGMILAREDMILVDIQYSQALSVVLPRIDLSLTAGEFFSGNRILESRNPVQAQLPTEFPQVNFGKFRDARTNNYSNPQLSLAITGTQLIYDGGRWWTAIQQVSDVRAARAADLEALANLVRAQVATSFYSLEKARQAVRTFRAQLAVDEEQVERARAVVRAGRGKPADVATAERNLARDEIQMRGFEALAAQAEQALNLQIGRSASTPLELSVLPEIATATVPVDARYLPDADRLNALTRAHRPELQSMKATLEALKKNVDIAMADYWPVVVLQSRYARNSRRPDRIINNPFDNYIATIDLALQWNLFAGLSTRAGVQRALVELRKQVAVNEALERVIFAAVQNWRRSLIQQREVHVLAQREIVAAQEAVRLARGLFEAGRGTSLELRDAELGLTQARLSAINARLEIEIAYHELVRAVGTSQWQVR